MESMITRISLICKEQPLYLACIFFGISVFLMILGRKILKVLIILMFLAGTYVMYLTYSGKKVPVTTRHMIEHGSEKWNNIRETASKKIKKSSEAN